MIHHLITCEYPPQIGGVSDYTRLVANGLAATGDEVHVWCPSANECNSDGGRQADTSGVFVHREFGTFTPRDLRRVSDSLDKFDGPRRLLVQWVPHGYGYRSMNLAFCLWLRQRAVKHRDDVDVMVHEPYLAFGEGSWRQNGVALVHRFMTIVILNAARNVWLSIPAWEKRLQPYQLGRTRSFRWLPVASTIPVINDSEGIKAVRTGYVANGNQLVGHFGTYDRRSCELLDRAVPALLTERGNCSVVLLGNGGEQTRSDLVRANPDLADRIHAPGFLKEVDLSLHVSACDVLLQPFVDGVTSRRTSVMAGLAHGIPIVTTRGRLTESLWEESDAIVLVPAADWRALVENATNLLSRADMRSRLAVAGKELYAQNFSLSRTITALREASPDG